MKKCFKCGAEKPLSSFYKHPQMSDGHVNKCKDCNKKDVRENRLSNVEHYREYDRTRGNRLSDGYTKEYRERYPAKARAVRKVNYHKRKGNLVQEPCEVCGTEKDIHAHHPDYAKPLNVMWLCAVHHKAWHDKHGEGLNGA